MRRDDTAGRLVGRRLQAARLRIWSRDPHCAMCRKLVDYPRGFQLDHIVPLFKGGGNDDENLQVLCLGPNGCHERKTADDLGYRFREVIGLDGYPE